MPQYLEMRGCMNENGPSNPDDAANNLLYLTVLPMPAKPKLSSDVYVQMHVSIDCRPFIG